MKKVLMFLLAASLSAPAVFAQNANAKREHKSPEEKAKMKTERLDKQLDLTDEQEAKVEQIYLNSARKMAELKEQKGDDKKAMGQDFKVIKQATNEQLKAVLTPEQMAKKEKMEAERREKHKNKKGKGHYKGKHDHKGGKKQ